MKGDLTIGVLPVVLTGNERADLGSVQRHPGVILLVEKIIKGHAQQQLHKIYEVDLADADRVTKLDAICSVAHAMEKTLQIVRRELLENLRYLQQEEEKGKQ